MKRKFINVTKEYIENLAPTDFCVETYSTCLGDSKYLWKL